MRSGYGLRSAKRETKDYFIKTRSNSRHSNGSNEPNGDVPSKDIKTKDGKKTDNQTLDNPQQGQLVREIYKGEWKSDKRHGYGVMETSDGYSYVGQWSENMRHGLGTATFPDNTKLEGEFENDNFISRVKKPSTIKSLVTRFKQRLQISCEAAQHAAAVSVQKSHMSLSRAAAARDRALEAAAAGEHAHKESIIAQKRARELIQRTPNSLNVPIPADK